MEAYDPKAFWEDRLTSNYNLRGVGYQSLGSGFNYWMYQSRARTFKHFIRKLGISREARTLDVGSGTGFYIDLLQQLGITNNTGIDLTEQAVEHLRARWPEKQFHQADITDGQLPLVQGPFDLITCFDVLFHIVDDQQYDRALANLSRLLKPGGVLLVSDNLASKEVRKKHHVSRTKPMVLKTVQAAGLEVESTIPQFVFLNEPVNKTFPLHQLWGMHVILFRYLPILGYPLGALYFPIERLALKLVKDPPSTQLLVCRKATAKLTNFNP